MGDPLLDQHEFPFTEDELFRALCLLQDGDDACEEARLIAACVRGEYEEGGWSVSDEVFAALALLSPELQSRANEYMRARWDAWRAGLVSSALHRERLPPGADPPPSLLGSADEEIAGYVADWEQGCTALADWVRRRQAGEPVGSDPPPWPGQQEDAE